MNEHDPRLELEPDRQTLQDAWRDLAEVLVLRGEEIEPMVGEFPVTSSGHQPYVFSHLLDKTFVHNQLLDDKSHSITSAVVGYSMPHKLEEDDSEIFDTVSVRWTAHMPGTNISINHSIVINRVSIDDDEQYRGYAEEEYIELLPNGRERRISKAGYEYSQAYVSDEDIEHALQDSEDDERILGIDDIENMHAVAAYLRQLLPKNKG